VSISDPAPCEDRGGHTSPFKRERQFPLGKRRQASYLAVCV